MPTPAAPTPMSHATAAQASPSSLSLRLTTPSAEAAALYREALDRIHGAEADAQSVLDRALSADPQLALAHVARAMLAQSDGDAARAARHLDAALGHLDDVSDAERGHLRCMAALLRRDPDAWATARAHLEAFPRDLLVASQLVGDLFFHGGDGKRRASLEVLRRMAPHAAGDWAFDVRLGFHMSELGDHAGAMPHLRPALARRPQAPFVAHAMAHALLESGERAASHAFLLDWLAAHDPTGPMDGHIHWHVSLGELERGEPAAAAARYLRHTAPGRSHCAIGLTLGDAGGLLGRMALEGTPLDGMPRQALRQTLASLGGILKVPFVAVHAAALALALDEPEALGRCVEAMRRQSPALGLDAGRRAVEAFERYAAGDMRACVALLARDRGRAFEAVGGSNEERALLARLHDHASARLAAA